MWLNEDAMPASANVKLYTGDDAEFFINFSDEDGTALDLSTYTGSAQIKRDAQSQDFTCTAVLQTNGFAEDVPGRLRVAMPKSTTRTLVPGMYLWDLQLTHNATQFTRTYLRGQAVVTGEITVE